MNRYLLRMVAAGLVACLLVDPSTAQTLAENFQPRVNSLSSIGSDHLREQALAASAAGVLCPLIIAGKLGWTHTPHSPFIQPIDLHTTPWSILHGWLSHSLACTLISVFAAGGLIAATIGTGGNAPDENAAQRRTLEKNQRISIQLAQVIRSRLPKGGLVIFRGFSGIGKTTLIKYVAAVLGDPGQRMVNTSPDALLKTDSERKTIKSAALKTRDVIRDEYRYSYRIEKVNHVFAEMLRYIGRKGATEARDFTPESPYLRPGESFEPWLVRPHDWVAIDSVVPDEFAAIGEARCDKLEIIILGDVGRARNQFQIRSSPNYQADELATHMDWYDRAIHPTDEDDVAEHPNADVIIDERGDTPTWRLWVAKPGSKISVEDVDRWKRLTLQEGQNASGKNVFVYCLVLSSALFGMIGRYGLPWPWATPSIAGYLTLILAAVLLVALDMGNRFPAWEEVARTIGGHTDWWTDYLKADLIAQSFIEIEEAVHRFNSDPRRRWNRGGHLKKIRLRRRLLARVVSFSDEAVAMTVALFGFPFRAAAEIIRLSRIQKPWKKTWLHTLLDFSDLIGPMYGPARILFFIAAALGIFIAPVFHLVLWLFPILLPLLIFDLVLSAGTGRLWQAPTPIEKETAEVVSAIRGWQPHFRYINDEHPMLNDLAQHMSLLERQIRQTETQGIWWYLNQLQQWRDLPEAAEWLQGKTLTGLLRPATARKIERWMLVDNDVFRTYGKKFKALFPELRIRDAKNPADHGDASANENDDLDSPSTGSGGSHSNALRRSA